MHRPEMALKGVFSGETVSTGNEHRQTWFSGGGPGTEARHSCVRHGAGSRLSLRPGSRRQTARHQIFGSAATDPGASIDQNVDLAGWPMLVGGVPGAVWVTGSVFGTPFVLAGLAMAAAATRAVASSMPRKIACNSGRASCRSLLRGADFLDFWLSTRAMVKFCQV